jgi:hypothetical protein
MKIEGLNCKKINFMDALLAWDSTNKRVFCIYMQALYKFPVDATYRKEFIVDGGMILDGEWFVEE